MLSRASRRKVPTVIAGLTVAFVAIYFVLVPDEGAGRNTRLAPGHGYLMSRAVSITQPRLLPGRAPYHAVLVPDLPHPPASSKAWHDMISPESAAYLRVQAPKFEGLGELPCLKLDAEQLFWAARSLGSAEHAPESRLWACALVYKSRRMDLQALDQEYLYEKAWMSPEYRFFLRDAARSALSRESQMCTRGWGAPSLYLGAGAYGLAYARCISTTECDNRIIVKMAGVEVAQESGTTFLAGGNDASVESFYNELMRVLVAHDVTPHLLMGLGVWYCDDFWSEPRGLLPSNLDCRKTKMKEVSAARGAGDQKAIDDDRRERSDACTVIVKDVEKKAMSTNMQLLAQEEIEVDLKGLLKQMAEDFKEDARHHRIASKAAMFQIVYTIAALQRQIPGFRHNDLSWYNIRATRPFATVTATAHASDGESVSGKLTDPQSGRVYAPRDAEGTPTTHTAYRYGGQNFTIPNYGYQVRIADWDFSHSLLGGRLNNIKVNYQSSKGEKCGIKRELADNGSYLYECRSVRASNVAVLNSTPQDDETNKSFDLNFTDTGGVDCKHYALLGTAQLCRRHAVDRGLSESEIEGILDACASACAATPDVRITVDRPATPSFLSVDDQADFTDSKGYDCSYWKGVDCGDVVSWGYPESERKSILDACPWACQQFVADEDQRHLVRLEGLGAVQDVVRPATAKAVSPTQWELTVHGTPYRTMVKRTGFGASSAAIAEAEAQTSPTLCFLKGSWFDVGHSNRTSISNDGWRYSVEVSPAVNGDVYRAIKDSIVAIRDSSMLPDGNYKVLDSQRVGGKVVLSLQSLFDWDRGPKPTKSKSIDTKRHRVVHKKSNINPYPMHGGFGWIVANPGKAKFYEYANYGITPVENRRFDLHFLFNQLRSKSFSSHYKDLFAEELAKWIDKEVFGDSVLRESQGLYTFDYRMTDYQSAFFCDQKGEMTTDSKVAREFPTPEEMLAMPYFAEFHRVDNPGSKQVSPTFNADVIIPSEVQVGTGELKIMPTRSGRPRKKKPKVPKMPKMSKMSTRERT